MKMRGLFLSLLLALAPTTRAADDIAGTWVGWCSNCVVEEFTLVVGADGDRGASTLQARGSNTFGDDVKALSDLIVDGNRVKFTTEGKSGEPFVVELRLSGGKLVGSGLYDNRATVDMTYERR